MVSRQHSPLGFSLTDFVLETTENKIIAYVSDMWIKVQKTKKGSDWKKDGGVNKDHRVLNNLFLT